MADTLDSTTLYDSYQGPHASRFDGQTITLQDTVADIGPDPYGLPCIGFGTRKRVIAVVAAPAGLAVGDRVTITGRSDGFTQGMVVMKHCRVVG